MNWQPNDTAIVLTRDRSSGKIHRRVRLADRPGYMTFERCQADQAGEFDILADLSDVSDEHEFCTVCFSPLESDDDTDSSGDIGGVPI